MGGEDVAEGERILNRAGISTLRHPDMAARMFDYMWRYAYNLRGIYETPVLPPASAEHDADLARIDEMIEVIRRSGRALLTEAESKQVLAAYNIPTVPMRIAATEEEAAQAAHELGYPVAVKLHSETITHKTDVGGVMLNLQDEGQVRHAFRARSGPR